MFTTTLKIILRNLYLDRLYTLINITGLAIGFCCFLVIFLYLRSELTVDQHFDKHEHIYRLTSEVFFDGVQSDHAKVGSLVAPLLAQDYEGFSDFVRFNPVTQGASVLVLNGDIGIQWDDFVYSADSRVFDVFSHTILAGNPVTALTEPRRLAISERVAKLFFGDEDPIGKTLALQVASNTYAIDLVFADLPANTSLKYDILISYNSNRGPSLDGNVEEYFEQGIVLFHDYTYFMLPENFDHDGFAGIADAFFVRYAAGPSARMFPGQNVNMDLKLQPLSDIYFAPFMDEDLPKGNRFNVYVLATIAVFILLVASINYMNLATARYARRAREVGLRRMLGAEKFGMVLQFLLEGLVFALLALLLGCSLVELLASSGVLANLLGQELRFSLLGDPVLLVQVLAVGVGLGLLSGLFPALYFISVRPIDVVKPVQSAKTARITLRGLLIGVQMLVSIGVVASAALMYLQIQFLNTQALGFDSANKLDIFVGRAGAQGSEFRALVERLATHPDVRGASMSDFVPGTVVTSQPVLLEGEAGGVVNTTLNSLTVDEHYLETLGITLLAGRNFDVYPYSSAEAEFIPYLVNEALVRLMGWQNPLGKELTFQVGDVKGRVVGVIADFNYRSLREEVAPLALEPWYDNYRWQRHLILDIDPDRLPQVLPYIEGVMKDFMPDWPFAYRFVDDTLESLYRADRQQLYLVAISSVLCIIIALLGLVGLTTFTLEQRTKEIGIRKLLGASSLRIMTLLFSRVFLLIVGAAVLASLAVWRVLGDWLQAFAYRVDISPLVFVFATAVVLVLAAVTVALQSWRVTREKPVKALRYE